MQTSFPRSAPRQRVQCCYHKAVGKSLSTPRGFGEKLARSLSGAAYSRLAFPYFDSYNFAAINHRGYARVLRQLGALQNRLFDCTKFERLTRYRCANLFFLVLPKGLFKEPEIPFGWGALIESDDELLLARKPLWHDVTPANRLKLLERIAGARTRVLNKESEITFDEVFAVRSRSCP